MNNRRSKVSHLQQKYRFFSHFPFQTKRKEKKMISLMNATKVLADDIVCSALAPNGTIVQMTKTM